MTGTCQEMIQFTGGKHFKDFEHAWILAGQAAREFLSLTSSRRKDVELF